MFNCKKLSCLFRKVRGLEERLDQIGTLVKEYNTKALIQLQDAVGIRVKCDYRCGNDYMVFFVKGTEPKCDFMIECRDGSIKYCKTVPETFTEINRDGSPLKVKKSKK